ncbi:hypothetical protein SUBVAR_07294 [Subdoligranulum variabile DSM 15176]|uniref:Uncharacterized protein n=1 Tax=Subdoligranulum variabile DSM 15176 TaxID=411471 RepID=D1PSB1_9FIRM|nr:hypothetical protein SUBVAR_07294 [Subdoligranulum variabile DSM 15176]
MERGPHFAKIRSFPQCSGPRGPRRCRTTPGWWAPCGTCCTTESNTDKPPRCERQRGGFVLT